MSEHNKQPHVTIAQQANDTPHLFPGEPVKPTPPTTEPAKPDAATPRTDAYIRELGNYPNLVHPDKQRYKAMKILARQLERELAALREQVRVKDEALGEAQNGLRWYQSEYPEAASPVDDEVHDRIEAALALTAKGGTT